MKILISGGSGLIGRALCRALTQTQHQLSVLSRRPQKVRRRCGAHVHALGHLDQWQPQTHYDAVINLAGAPILGQRWHADRKQVLRQSRIDLTQTLVDKIRQADTPPEVLLSASAIGYYGDCGDLDVTEASPPQADFGSRLCQEWEQAAQTAGVRVCRLRTGLVLSTDGGALQQMRWPFKLGLGAQIGHGQQWMSWIHIEDTVNAILHLLNNPTSQAAYNLTAPTPVRNAEFTHTLAQALNRRVRLSTPAWVIRAALGEAAYLLLGGQKVQPTRLLAEGFEFKHAQLPGALAALFAQG